MRLKGLGVVALVGACGSHGHSMNMPPSGARSLKTHLELSGVIGLAIAKSGSPRLADDPATMPDAASCTNSNLYTVDASGAMTITTVTYTPAMGDAGAMCDTSMAMESATGIFDSAKYDIITYTGLTVACPGSTDAPCNLQCPYVVLRKADGALYCGPQLMDGGDNVTSLQGNGDILTLGVSGGGLVRLDMAMDPPKATFADDPVTTGVSIARFEINNANDALADGSTNASAWLRIYKASGGLMNILAAPMSGNFPGFAHWYNAANDTFYYTEYTNTGNGFGVQKTYQLAAGTYAATVLGSYNRAPTNDSPVVVATMNQVYSVQNGYLVDMLPSAAGSVCTTSTTTGHTFTRCSTNADCAGTCTPSGGPGAPTCVGGPWNGFTCGTGSVAGDCSDTCQLGGAAHALSGGGGTAYASGTNIFLVGADMAGNSYVDGVDVSQVGEALCSTTGCTSDSGCCSSPLTPNVLLAPGAYSLSHVALSRSGELTFIGVQFSDGASVVGNCTATACTVLSAMAPAVSTLVRIN